MKYEASAAETNIYEAIAQYGINGFISRPNLTVWETAVARSMAKNGLLIQHEDAEFNITGYSLPTVATTVEQSTPTNPAKGMTKIERMKGNAVKSALFTRNILAVYYSASPADIQGGSDWYERANAIAQNFAATYGLPLEQCAGVISAISPRKAWSLNVRIAESIISRYTATGLSAVKHGGTLSAQLRQADKVLALVNPTATEVGDSFGGPKTAAFARNIIGDLSGVCVDGHASNIAFHGMTRLGIPDATSPKGPLYDLIAAAYTTAAKKLGIAPATLQAITWLAYKSIPIPKKVGQKSAK